MGDDDKKEKKAPIPQPIVGFATFLMALINILTVACYGMMVAYTTVYLTGIRTVVLGFVQFSMGFIALILAVLSAPMSELYYEHFPVFNHPPDRAFTIGLWQCALAAFIVGDPLFMELRDPKIAKSKATWAQAMGPLTFATAIALGAGFLMGIYGFLMFSNDGHPKEKKKDEDGDEID
ncbi:hypothetical protein GGF42_000749 [Coemansia sp. RSA 2424]|nr:hypothetical protein GGF42_000749 [Coemansia sp. RSA 2424]